MMQGSLPTPPGLNGDGLVIGMAQARFNADITHALLQAARTQLLALGVAADDIDVVEVPGALELPLALQAMARSDRYDALIALGCVIRGQTYHFELVANESARGIMQVSLAHQLPIANAVLTTEDLAQAQARVKAKGQDAANLAVELAMLLEDLD
jgi:6,7-dimethyl-8-ribityllumazine synthase